MTSYFIRRLLLIIPTFLGVTIIAFGITRFLPGGPVEREIMRMRMATASEGVGGGGAGSVLDPTSEMTEAAKKEIEKAFGFDKPIHVAYWDWLKRVCVLDFGTSYNFQEPVWNMIIDRFHISLIFGSLGFLGAYLVSIPLGIFKALRHGSYFDFGSSAIVFIGYSIPGWALGVLLLTFLATDRFADILPLGDIKTGSYQNLPQIIKDIEQDNVIYDDTGTLIWEKMSFTSKLIDRIYHMILPVFCYMMGSFASLTILTKNSLMENLGQDYVRTAFAKGLAPRRVIFVHTLRNSLIPLATGLGHALGYIMAGSYLIEMVFNIDGIGYLGFTSILQRDYTVVMGILSLNVMLTLFGNIFSDILYAVIDPRIRFE